MNSEDVSVLCVIIINAKKYPRKQTKYETQNIYLKILHIILILQLFAEKKHVKILVSEYCFHPLIFMCILVIA